MKKGETVLVHGATGATGLAAVQLCSALGVDTVISGGADSKVEIIILILNKNLFCITVDFNSK